MDCSIIVLWITSIAGDNRQAVERTGRYRTPTPVREAVWIITCVPADYVCGLGSSAVEQCVCIYMWVWRGRLKGGWGVEGLIHLLEEAHPRLPVSHTRCTHVSLNIWAVFFCLVWIFSDTLFCVSHYPVFTRTGWHDVELGRTEHITFHQLRICACQTACQSQIHYRAGGCGSAALCNAVRRDSLSMVESWVGRWYLV